ncbi:MAG: hypothetical protein IPK64_16170 [bacterium]|nr:hypothetical protein [bacterium]
MNRPGSRLASGWAMFALLLALAVPAVTARAQISDDFSGPALNPALWSVVDAIGDGTYAQANGQLSLMVPAGTAHDLWVPANEALRMVQAATDGDLSLEVKFESAPAAAYQMQGLLVEAGPGEYLRADFLHDMSHLQLFCATFSGGVPQVRGSVAVPAGQPLWLRLARVGHDFAVDWSDDGIAWQPAFAFTHVMQVSAVGVYAGNEGAPAPAFSAVVDYFFDTNAPIVPEDGDVVDTWPPAIGSIAVVPDTGTGTAVVTCTTTEPATTVLSWGPDTSYGTEVPGATGDRYHHQFTLTGLALDTTVHYRIAAVDTLANTAVTADRQFAFTQTRPRITVWGGLDQRVGHLGTAQADFNLMGHVERWEDLTSLTWSLNGGPTRPLNWGQGAGDWGDYRRLAHNGDFNVDVALGELAPGVNTITVRAADPWGGQDQVTANVTLGTGATPLPLLVDWSAAATPQDAGQAVDGNWVLEPGGLRTASVGYDRIFLLGEIDWLDWEVTCAVSIHEVQTSTGPLSDGAGLGFLARFAGHVVGGFRNFPIAQPKWGYQPFGALTWLRWTGGAAASPAIQFYRGDSDATQDFGVAAGALGGTEWRLRMRCETLPDAPGGAGVTRYSFKVWPAAVAEPAAWNYEVEQESIHALRQGSLGLVAHHVDVTFGDVIVSELGHVAAVDDASPRGRPALAGAWPNPFNPRTTISFELPAPSRTRVTILDLRGSLVATVAEADLGAGRHQVVWTGRDDAGRAVPSGPYLCRLQAGRHEAVTKLLLLR